MTAVGTDWLVALDGGADIYGGVARGGGADIYGGVARGGGADIYGGVALDGGADIYGSVARGGGADIYGGVARGGGADIYGGVALDGGADIRGKVALADILGGGDETEAWKLIKKVRRIRELYHGRFTDKQANTLLRHNNWDVIRTNTFILDALPGELRDVVGEDDWQVVGARQNNVIRDLGRRSEVRTEVRQFGCQPCDRMWWFMVPTRKQVSRCNTCIPKRRYDAIPRDLEWGWAKFQCPCGNEFHGFGAMQNSLAVCYWCNENVCPPVAIIPPLKKHEHRPAARSLRHVNTHSCCAPNCFNRRMPEMPLEENVTLCVHPKSLTRKVVEPSTCHVSSGSTVDTFLSQADLQSPYDEYEPSLAEISEDGDNM